MKLITLGLATATAFVFANSIPLAAAAELEGPRALAIELGAPFHDHAVLQRGMAVPVWGWSKPGTKVTVGFAGQTTTATAGDDGKWTAELKDLKASFEPGELVIREEGGKTETLTNILVGEVWMASGQSNMQWLAAKSSVSKLAQELAAETADDASPPAPLQARVVVKANSAARPYDRMIFGGFLEHFDNQVYGGIFDPGSPLVDAQGFRNDVIEALRELKTPIIRWPGGCFVDSYRWRNGVGAERTSHGDFRWGVIDPNTFGTHEFVALCRKIGAEPYICLNGLADPRENLDWVAYCNATEGPMAELRKANGHPAPLNVKYWSVGNERYDCAYIHRVRDTARAMKATYPGILISCSGAQDGTAIHPYLLEQAGAHLDFVSIHSYALPRANDLPRFDYLTAVGKSDEAGKFMTKVSAALADAGVAGRIRIAYDEWNLRAWQHPGFPRDAVGSYDDPAIRELVDRRRRQNDTASDYTMADALFTASFLNACLRHAEHVTMANIAPLVNTRGPLFVHPEGIVKRTHFHVMAMYANLLEERVVDSHITAEPLTDGSHSVAVIDAIATIDASGKRRAVALINRHPQRSVICTLRIGNLMLDGLHPATVLHADSADAFNDITHPDRVKPRQAELRFQNNTTTLPPHSLTIVTLAAPPQEGRGNQ